MLKRWMSVIALSAVFFQALPVWAAGGTGMPWDNPLNTITASITGPVAYAFILIAIVVFGFAAAWSLGGILGRAINVLFGASIVAAAASFFMPLFGFGAGVLLP